ncbi:hypothetical protein [Nostoc sp. NMS8]|nr:hypothetical protein [Nostoc sp. NMS8]
MYKPVDYPLQLEGVKLLAAYDSDRCIYFGHSEKIAFTEESHV